MSSAANGLYGDQVPASAVDPYQRLDQAAPAALLHSAANRVAVGVHDPALGWVEINTQTAAGQISAALVASSSSTHASLAAQLPSISQYLSEQAVRVDHLGVEQHGWPLQQQAAGGYGDGTGQSQGAGGGGAAGSGHEGSPPAVGWSDGPSPGSASEWGDDPGAGWGEEDLAVPMSYISVRA